MPEQRRVLLIEDDPAMEMAMRERFRLVGFALDYAAEGYEALEKLRASTYDAIILDLMIRHGLNGFGVLNFLEMEQPVMLDRVFLTTGMSEQTIMNTAPQMMPRFFRKPFDAARLVAAVVAVAEAKPGSAAATMKQVLIVEDDPVTSHLLNLIVKSLGIDAQIVDNGRDAIRVLAIQDFDVILLDLVLPDLDGFAVIDFIERTRPGALKRTIVTTGVPERYRKAVDTNMVCGLIEKPIDATMLRQMITNCVESR